MTSARIAKLLLLCGLAAPWSAAQQAGNQSALTLTISQTSPKPTFRIDLHNAGKAPLHLHLGDMLGGTKELAIDLSLTDDKGRTIPLVSRPDFLLEGRMDPFIVTLAPGATWPFPIDLKDYHWQKGNDFVSLSLAPGRYTLTAVYTGRNFPGVIPPEYQTETGIWKGTVTSNALPFTIPEKTAQ